MEDVKKMEMLYVSNSFEDSDYKRSKDISPERNVEQFRENFFKIEDNNRACLR